MVRGIAYAGLIASGFVMAMPVPAVAHDLDGLMRRKALAPEIRKPLEAAERLRRALGPERPDPAALAASPSKRQALQAARPAAGAVEALESVFDARALWPDGYRLRACFFDGHAAGRATVLRIAREIVAHTNLDIEPLARDCDRTVASDIRITFKANSGLSSYIGTEAHTFARLDEPTLTLAGLDLVEPMSEASLGIVRHEVMHALGALHEHQHPDAGCETTIRKDVVARRERWTPADVEINLQQFVWGDYILRDVRRDVVGSPIDRASIMHYQLPADYFVGGEQNACWLTMANTQVSDGDVAMLRRLYPKP